MSSRMGSLSSVADDFVAAALDPSRWDSAMDGAARAMPLVGRCRLRCGTDAPRPDTAWIKGPHDGSVFATPNWRLHWPLGL